MAFGAVVALAIAFVLGEVAKEAEGFGVFGVGTDCILQVVLAGELVARAKVDDRQVGHDRGGIGLGVQLVFQEGYRAGGGIQMEPGERHAKHRLWVIGLVA